MNLCVHAYINSNGILGINYVITGTEMNTLDRTQKLEYENIRSELNWTDV